MATTARKTQGEDGIPARRTEKAVRAAAAHAGTPVRVTVQRQEIATATLTVQWAEEVGSSPRRARLAVLHRIAAEACLQLEAFPIAVSCADPIITMGDARGLVRLELADESDYPAAAALLADASERVVPCQVVRA